MHAPENLVLARFQSTKPNVIFSVQCKLQTSKPSKTVVTLKLEKRFSFNAVDILVTS